MPGLLHMGLTVANLERSVAFYRDIVGMEVSGPESNDFSSDAFDTLTSNPGARFKMAHLTSGEFTLQVLEYTAGGAGVTLDLHHNHKGSPHLCFDVDDVLAKFEELQKRGGVTITSGIVQLNPQTRSFYTEDPDGVPVEFLQRGT